MSVNFLNSFFYTIRRRMRLKAVFSLNKQAINCFSVLNILNYLVPSSSTLSPNKYSLVWKTSNPRYYYS